MNWVELLGVEWWDRATALANKLAGSMPPPYKVRQAAGDVYPPRSEVFAAFDEVHPSDISVVILGQDPYHSPGKARGVAFGYHPDYQGAVNSSMMNIVVELSHEYPQWELAPPREWYTLKHWTEQGVLLLNTRLTVPHEQPMGHAGLGWEPLMREALQKIVKWCQPPILAWGAEARKFAKRSGAWTVIDTSHPCKYSATRGKKPFLGSKCFDLVNEALGHQQEEPINWAGV